MRRYSISDFELKLLYQFIFRIKRHEPIQLRTCIIMHGEMQTADPRSNGKNNARRNPTIGWEKESRKESVRHGTACTKSQEQDEEETRYSDRVASH